VSERKNRLRKMLEAEPMCIFCGGTVLATTVEHAPPKILFLQSLRLQGFEFSACARCNNGHSQLDQLVALYSLIQSEKISNGNSEAELHLEKIAKGVKNNYGGIFKNPNPVFSSSKLGGFLRPAITVNTTENAVKDIAMWCAKQSIALWYKETGKIFSESASINLNFYNTTYQIEKFANPLLSKFGMPEFLRQGSKNSVDQFFYRPMIESGHRIGFIWVVYHEAFAFLSIICEPQTENFVDVNLRYSYKTSAENGIYLAEFRNH
jgi:hypothetical protein